MNPKNNIKKLESLFSGVLVFIFFISHFMNDFGIRNISQGWQVR